MKIIVKEGLMFRDESGHESIMDCPEADAIACANGMWCAENITKKFDGKSLEIDEKTLKIKLIEEDFI